MQWQLQVAGLLPFKDSKDVELCLSNRAVAFKGAWPNIVQNVHEVMEVSVFSGCSKRAGPSRAHGGG